MSTRGPQQHGGTAAEVVVDLDGVYDGTGGDEEAVRFAGPPRCHLLRVGTETTFPITVDGDGTGPLGGVTRLGDSARMGGIGIAIRIGSRNHRPTTPCETDRLGPQLDTEGSTPAIRPLGVQHVVLAPPRK